MITDLSEEASTLAKALDLPLSLAQVLQKRGFHTVESAAAFLSPSLDQLDSPEVFAQMAAAVERLRRALREEESIAIYADRDVDGLTGLAVLVRALRALGGHVVWSSPEQGRGVERSVLQKLLHHQPKVMIFIDCGSGDPAELRWLMEQGLEVIVADHHRLSSDRPPVLAWIHPELREDPGSAAPSGCVMAFKLAQALWHSFLGQEDQARLDYFLFDHLDLVSLATLADRMPLVGENRVLVWHGLQRLAHTRKVGLSSLMRFFRLTPRSSAVTPREASWQLIPLLNAGGRMGRPEVTAQLLLTEDPTIARDCLDELLTLNAQRRAAQTQSQERFEEAVVEQCALESDPVLIARAEGLEPSVTGLAAQALATKYGRPVFLFVTQGEMMVGSGRGLSGDDLYKWVEAERKWLVKFGGHDGAVGLTVRAADFQRVKERLRIHATDDASCPGEVTPGVEAEISLAELDAAWWNQLLRLGPFGPGHPWPVLRLNAIESICPASRRGRAAAPSCLLKTGSVKVMAEWLTGAVPPQTEGAGPWTVIGYPMACRKSEGLFKWMIQEARKENGKNN